MSKLECPTDGCDLSDGVFIVQRYEGESHYRAEIIDGVVVGDHSDEDTQWEESVSADVHCVACGVTLSLDFEWGP